MEFDDYSCYNPFIAISTYLKGHSMNIAILIDAENINPAYAEQIFTLAEARGTIVAREIYGAGIALNKWSDAILQYALHTNLTLRPNRFKNSTDIALVIGAMDLLLERNACGTTSEQGTTPDIVMIASSDSDYSALALRLRTSGINVIGIGEKGCINPSWPMACSEFIALTPADEMRQEGRSKPHTIQTTDHQTAACGTNDSPERRRHNDRVAAIRDFITSQLSKNNGQMPSSTLFNLLRELPDYLCDQQRSKRAPVEYLSRQYGDLLKIRKNADGALWVYSKLTDIADSTETGDESAAAPIQETPPDTDTESTSLSLMEFLRGAGVDGTDAQTVSSVYKECPNMRDVYNVLRKTFKAGTGAAYYQLVKQHREAQKQTQ